ncbi:hypothetical protein AB0M43_10135 [Longispora sp. NPDC051575]|uniref:hypothetical protein n=1 Tax=Longispora sp. NPDC051575 TaxID=3154943 RepID=UPI0034476E0A
MTILRSRRTAASVAAVLAGTGLALAPTAARAAPSSGLAITAIGYCRDIDPGYPASDGQSLCAKVTGINAGSYLGVRTTPHYGSPVLYRLYNGNTVEVDCWTTGDGAADKPSYRYWMGLYRASGPAYVNDWYLTTGGPGTWQPRLTHC